MSDILIATKSSALTTKIMNVVDNFGLRTKCVSDLKSAEQWIGLKRFDCACVGEDFSIAEIEKLSEGLWKMNNRATLVVVGDEDKPLNPEPDNYRWKISLLGAEYAAGLDWRDKLEAAIRSMARVKPTPLSQYQVLVVEDLESPRDIICAFVEHLGFSTVKGVHSASEALKELEAHPDRYFCVVSDINMPEINGQDLIRSIRAHDKLQHLPVVVLTAYGTPENLIDCLKEGASGFLVKPPARNQFQRELNRAFRLFVNHENPRLATEQDVDQLREVLVEKGL